MAAPLSLLENPRPATRVAGRKTAPGIFLQPPTTRARQNRPQVTKSRRVKNAAATKSASGVRDQDNRYRVYSLNLGRFTAADPIGFGGGLNLHRYGSNSPVRYTDPLGLCCEAEKAAMDKAYAGIGELIAEHNAARDLMSELGEDFDEQRTKALELLDEIGNEYDDLVWNGLFMSVACAAAGTEVLDKALKGELDLDNMRQLAATSSGCGASLYSFNTQLRQYQDHAQAINKAAAHMRSISAQVNFLSGNMNRIVNEKYPAAKVQHDSAVTAYHNCLRSQ